MLVISSAIILSSKEITNASVRLCWCTNWSATLLIICSKVRCFCNEAHIIIVIHRSGKIAEYKEDRIWLKLMSHVSDIVVRYV